MRGSARKPPRGIREKAGMSFTRQDRASASVLPALSPSSSSSFPAWLPPVLIFLSPKSLSWGSPPTSPFRATHSPLSVSPPHPLCPASLCPNPGFQGLLLCFPSPLPGPSTSSSSASEPWSSWGGLRSGTHRCQPGSGFGELQGEQSSQGGPSTPCRAQLPIPCPTDPPWGAHRAEGLPEHPHTAP